MWSFISKYFTSNEPDPYKLNAELLLSKFLDPGTIGDFLDHVNKCKALISGNAALRILGLDVPVDHIDIYINIFDVNDFIEYMIARGYKIFYINDCLVLSTHWILDAFNYSYVTKICNCNNTFTGNPCYDPRCINGSFRLFICNGSPSTVIDHNANISYQYTKYNGKVMSGEYLDITKQGIAMCYPDDIPNRLAAEKLGFTVIDEPLTESNTLGYAGFCDLSIVQSEIYHGEQYEYTELFDKKWAHYPCLYKIIPTNV